MIGVFLDGTWARDTLGAGDETNISRMAKAWRGPALYVDGIGSRQGWLQRMFGGAFGFGARGRVQSAISYISALNHSREVAIFGWSRGGAMAVHLAHELLDLGVSVAYLGLLDPVAQFWLPGRHLNLGWRLRTPKVGTAVVIYALDERSRWFPPLQVDGHRFWINGDHSDLGRGTHALNLLANDARFSGCPIHSGHFGPVRLAPPSSRQPNRTKYIRPTDHDLRRSLK